MTIEERRQWKNGFMLCVLIPEFEPVIRAAMALEQKKTLPQGSYCPECGIRQEMKTFARGSVGPVHFPKCSYVNHTVTEVDHAES